MKTLYTVIAALALTSVCWGWNCPSGQIRQQAPAGTPTTTPFYDVVEGIAFICVPTTPPTTPTSGVNTNNNTNKNDNTVNAVNTNTNTANSASNANSSSTSSAKQSQKQQQQQNQSQGQNQTATGGNASSSSTSTGGDAVGNGVNSNNSITNIAAPKIPVNSAITPPIMPTVPCFKGMGGAVQTMGFGGSFGGGKVDQGCDDRELARSFSGPQTVASCKILVATKKAKKAGITLEDCLGIQPIAVQPVTQVIVPEPVIVPPVIVVVQPPLVLPTPTPVKPVLKRKVVHHLPPNCQNVLQRVCK